MAQPFVGEIRLFAGSFAPLGWATCNGALLPISEFDTLFNLIGTTYGGDGEQTFALPDLQGRVPLHQGRSSSGTTYPLGDKAGVEQVTLSVAQIPQHQHSLLASSAPGTSDRPGGNVLATPPTVRPYVADLPDTSLSPALLAATGGSQPHENRQPFVALSFIISLFGIFPTQA